MAMVDHPHCILLVCARDGLQELVPMFTWLLLAQEHFGLQASATSGSHETVRSVTPKTTGAHTNISSVIL